MYLVNEVFENERLQLTMCFHKLTFYLNTIISAKPLTRPLKSLSILEFKIYLLIFLMVGFVYGMFGFNFEDKLHNNDSHKLHHG